MPLKILPQIRSMSSGFSPTSHFPIWSTNAEIARLATGVQRFDLPPEHNHIRLLIEAAREGRGSWSSVAAALLPGLFENRQQYPRAAAAWREALERFGPGNNMFRRKKLNQIVGRWGQFERATVAAAGTARHGVPAHPDAPAAVRLGPRGAARYVGGEARWL